MQPVAMRDSWFVVYHQNPKGGRTDINTGIYANFAEAVQASLELLMFSRTKGDHGSVYGVRAVNIPNPDNL